LRQDGRGSVRAPTRDPSAGRAPRPRGSRRCGVCARIWGRGCPARLSASRPRRRRRGVAVALLLVGGVLGGLLAVLLLRRRLGLLALLANELGLGLDFFLDFGLEAGRR